MAEMPGWRVLSVAMAAGFSYVILIAVRPHWTRSELVPGVLIFVVLFTLLYRAALWIFVDHPTKLRKKLPISSRELREQRKTFYDWLSSHVTQQQTTTRKRRPNDFI